jgi:NADH:ubiquinone oxidoreductase subunit D
LDEAAAEDERVEAAQGLNVLVVLSKGKHNAERNKERGPCSAKSGETQRTLNVSDPTRVSDLKSALPTSTLCNGNRAPKQRKFGRK